MRDATWPLCALMFAAACGSTAWAADLAPPRGEARRAAWPQFRGPSANGLAPEAAFPSAWGSPKAGSSQPENVAWAVDIPGRGWSAPVVAGERVIVTTAAPGDGDALRFEAHAYGLATGELDWKRVVYEGPPRLPTHQDNTYATETPVVDGDNVYVYFGMTRLACFSLAGEERWSIDPGNFPMMHGWGTASSPAVASGLLFLQLDNESDSHLVAFDPRNGSEVWRVARTGEVSNWSTPIVWRNTQREELILSGDTVRSYDPRTGRELWSMAIGGRSSASPTAVGDVLYVGSENRAARGGTPGGLFAVRAGASGAIDATKPAEGAQSGLLWANPRGAIGMASPLVVEGLVYVLERNGGVIRAHDAATGEQVYRRRLPGGAAVWSSPWSAGGLVYCLDEAGTTFVLRPGRSLDVVGTNRLEGRFWSTPAVAGDALLVRSADRLYCIRKP